MKINQTDTQLELKTNGIAQVIIGTIFALIGVAVSIFILTSSTKSDDPSSIWFAAMGIPFVAIGAYIVFSSHNRQVVINKGGITTVVTKRTIGGTPQTQSFETSHIVAIQLATYLSSNNSGTERRSTLSLITNDNNLIEIADKGSKAPSINGFSITGLVKAPLSKEANRIAAYLGVPLQASDNSNPINVIESAVNSYSEAIGKADVFDAQPEQVTITQPSEPVAEEIKPFQPPTVLPQ